MQTSRGGCELARDWWDLVLLKEEMAAEQEALSLASPHPTPTPLCVGQAPCPTFSPSLLGGSHPGFTRKRDQQASYPQPFSCHLLSPLDQVSPFSSPPGPAPRRTCFSFLSSPVPSTSPCGGVVPMLPLFAPCTLLFPREPLLYHPQPM